MNQPSTLPRMQLATLKAATWLLSLTLAVAAHAAAPTSKEGPPDGGPRAHAFAEHRQQKLEELHQQLALDKSQEAQWNSAKEMTAKLHQEMMEAHRAFHEQTKAELAKPAPDLRGLAAKTDKMRDEHMQKRKAVREAWLKFYDGLNPTQKEKASHFMLSQISMMGEGAGHPGGMMMHRHHGEGEAGEHEHGGPGPRPSGPQ